MLRIFLFLLVLVPFEANGGATNKHAHVHGSGKITLALETFTDGTIDLDIPSESIWGFEHAAHTPAEKSAQEKGFRQLRGNPYSVVRLPSDCEIKVKKAEIEKADPEEKPAPGQREGEHTDINASYSVKCTNSLAGVKVWVGMFEVFPRVKGISLTVLSPNGQMEQKFTSSHEFLTLPK